MKNLLTKLVKKIKGRNYIHIPKKEWAKKLVKKCLNVERIRGRGRDWEAITKKEWQLVTKDNDYNFGCFTKKLGYDGSVPLKYSTYLYVKLQ